MLLQGFYVSNILIDSKNTDILRNPEKKIEHSNLNVTPIGAATGPQKRVYS